MIHHTGPLTIDFLDGVVSGATEIRCMLPPHDVGEQIINDDVNRLWKPEASSLKPQA